MSGPGECLPCAGFGVFGDGATVADMDDDCVGAVRKKADQRRRKVAWSKLLLLGGAVEGFPCFVDPCEERVVIGSARVCRKMLASPKTKRTGCGYAPLTLRGAASTVAKHADQLGST